MKFYTEKYKKKTITASAHFFFMCKEITIKKKERIVRGYKSEKESFVLMAIRSFLSRKNNFLSLFRRFKFFK